MKPSLVFFGNERIATGTTTRAPILRSLIKAGYPIESLIVNYEPARSRQDRRLEVLRVAEDHAIPVYTPKSNGELQSIITLQKSKTAVLVAYGRMVPQSVIDHFPGGILNVHPSLLPRHRGSIPVESVLVNGETETGVSIMQLSSAMDAGPVYMQTHMKLRGNETKQELADALADQGLNALIECLPNILAGTLTPTPQNEAEATYDQRITKAMGIIDWKKPAVRIEREIRAYSGWPRSRTVLYNKDVIVTHAHVANKETVLAVECGDGTFLEIDRLIPAGKKEMTAAEFQRGFQKDN